MTQIPKNDAAGQKLLEELQTKQKLCGVIGLARKAGKLVAGTELCVSAMRSSSPKKVPVCVFLAADASENTRKRINNSCDYYEVPCEKLKLTTEELGKTVGKAGLISAVAVTDRGLCDAIHAHNQL